MIHPIENDAYTTPMEECDDGNLILADG